MFQKMLGVFPRRYHIEDAKNYGGIADTTEIISAGYNAERPDKKEPARYGSGPAGS